MMTDFSDFRMGSEFVLGGYGPGSVRKHRQALVAILDSRPLCMAQA
jgi:hypothetical protein